MRIGVCAIVPTKAVVSEVLLFSRPDGSQQPWSESRVTMGQEAGGARFRRSAGRKTVRRKHEAGVLDLHTLGERQGAHGSDRGEVRALKLLSYT
jgi:hypothetical protein